MKVSTVCLTQHKHQIIMLVHNKKKDERSIAVVISWTVTTSLMASMKICSGIFIMFYSKKKAFVFKYLIYMHTHTHTY